MKRRKGRRGLAAALVLIMAINFCLGYPGTFSSSAYTERSATVNATNLNVRSGPGTTYSVVTKLSQGTAVTVIGEKTASDGALWYEIRFSGANGAETTGYASNSYIKFPVAYTSDGDFEAHLSAEGFPESYKVRLRQLHAQYPKWVFRAQKTNLDWNTAVQNESVVGRNLVAQSSISSWKSTAAGAYNWDTSSWPGFDSSAWVAASEDIIRYYMDPRNFLDEVSVFQFLLQSYDSESHTVEGLRSMVKGTFLDGTAAGGSPSSGGEGPGGASGPGDSKASDPGSSSGGPGVGGPGAGSDGQNGVGSGGQNGASDGQNSQQPSSQGDAGVSLEGPQASVSRNQTEILASSYGPGIVGGSPSQDNSPSQAPVSGSASYIDIILNAGVQSGVNPYVLAAMIIQEQHTTGTGGSISGTEPGYEGYYNFFNIEAYKSGGLTPVQRGLWYASQSGSYERPWNSPERSILGGAVYYGQNYVKAGQDTFYLKKYNVQGNNLYKHQYMTNVQGAAAEASFYAKAYKDEMKQTALEFKIPVFNNMPENPSPKPSIDGSPNNKLSDLSVSGFVLTPTYNKDSLEYDLIVDPSVSNVTVNATAIDSRATVKGAGNISLQSGDNQIKISVTAQNGSVREYVLHVVRQNNGPTYSEGVGGSGNPGSGPGGSDPSGGSNPSGGGTQAGSTGGPGSGSGTGNSGSSAGSPGGSTGSTGNGSGNSGNSSGNPGNAGSPESGGTGGPGSDGQGTQSTDKGSGGQTPGGSNVTIIPMGSMSSLMGNAVSMGGAVLEGPAQSGVSNQIQTGTPTPVQQPTSGQPSQTEAPKPSGGAGSRGDINGDGKVNSLDVLKIQRHLLGLEELQSGMRSAADVNGDGKINSLDLLILQKRILGIES